MTEMVDFRLLGPLEVLVRGDQVPIGGPRQRVVLTMLLLNAGRVVSVDSLVETVWGTRPPSSSRTQVAICVSALRKTFRERGVERKLIETAAPGYVLRPEGHRMDTLVFEELVAEARARRGRLAEAVRCYDAALALRRGPVLSNVTGAVPEHAATQWEESLLAAYEEQVELRLQLGEHRLLVAGLVDAVDRHPLRDRLHGLLMTAQYQSGQRVAALETFVRWRRRSIEELGLEPSVELRRLHERILLDEGGPVVDRPPAQLPAATQAFTGRAESLAALDGLAARGGRGGAPPLGLLVGGVGVGKTALAVWWGARNADLFPDGQLFVDLSGHDPRRAPVDPHTALTYLLHALGVPPERVPSPAERPALFRTLVADRRMLLVLDDARDAAQVWPLVPNSPTCQVLVTSRSTLRELVARCGTVPLRLGGLRQDEAVQLVRGIVGAARVGRDPEAVSQLVELCGRLPGALSAAAARLAGKPHWDVPRMVRELRRPAGRLTGFGGGGQRLHDGLASSARRLDPVAAHLYQALGGLPAPELTSWTAEALLGCSAPDADDVLERLVDAHLLEPAVSGADGEARYRLPSLPHAYAAELATAPPPAQAGGSVSGREASSGLRRPATADVT
ncbi:AfsR/SARP family transcriptional regulator [Actinoalloteichus fjordicus]|uniref:DNA-binding transcriptional activator of the SARP family n=1 Tax=Actinoalloteichus fjordicus TaxID=1612552 RepID=A0AAC9LCW6_9PSEU|nr:BTAD domain-containing putative transcriptional regulator [Actinoalloteichus fjordicus]APU15011.1 DNA-binding transcriptional activator of the SARP family [Actinoalloteichus fjordicus]